MKENTVVTCGDINYLWGLFLLIGSMRKSGMREKVLVGTRKFDARAERVLKQFGGVELTPVEENGYSLTCMKANVMLRAKTEIVTWADSDAIFTGNCSGYLAPLNDHEIHVRRRGAAEMPGAFPAKYDRAAILDTWRRDIASLAPARPREAVKTEDFRSCSACFLSVARDEELFLSTWDRLMMTALPAHNVGVVDKSLEFYHQLDESCLNATLEFLDGAPRVSDVYRLDKDRDAYFVHFIGRTKPWVAWVPRAARSIDVTCAIVDWAKTEKLELPGKVPFALESAHKSLCRRLAPATEIFFKVRRKLGM